MFLSDCPVWSVVITFALNRSVSSFECTESKCFWMITVDVNVVILQLNVPFEPVVLQPTLSELWEGLVNKVAMALTDQVCSPAFLSFKKPVHERAKPKCRRK